MTMIFELSSSFNSINLKGCPDLRILYSHDKRKLSNGNYGKKLVPFIELCSFFIDILAFELGKLCPGVGILFRFFDSGAGVLH